MVRSVALKQVNILVWALVILLMLSILGIGLINARAATISVRVRADVIWVDTGIVVTAGESVAIKATGLAITGPLNQYPEAKSGPEGQAVNDSCGTYLPAGPCTLDGALYGALIGRVGISGAPFYIGDASSFTPSTSGALYLAVNDNLAFYDDNSAGYTVLFK